MTSPTSRASGLFLHLNTNKKSVAVDVSKAAGRKVVLDLARDADILVESFAPGTMASLGPRLRGAFEDVTRAWS